MATLSRNPGRGSVTRNTVVTYSAFDATSGRSIPLSFRNQAPSDENGVAMAKVLLGSVDFVGTATIQAQVGAVKGEEDIDIDASGSRPDISVTPTRVDFGPVTVGMSSEQVVTIHNDGTATLTVQSLTLTGTGFTFVDKPTLPSAVAPGDETLPVTIKFTPTDPGMQSGTLVITSNDPDEGSVTVKLTGVGQVSGR